MKPIDEVQLTAYALGEGSAAVRQQIEEQLQANPAAQAAVAEIQALAAQLEADLANEPAFSLTDAQRQAIFRAPAQPAGRLVRFPWRKVTGFAAVAALVMLVFGGAFWGASRALHRNLLLSLNDQGEMAVDPEGEVQMVDEFKPADELPDIVELNAPTEEAPPPEIMDFCAAPAMNGVAELASASDRISPIVMRNLAPGAMASRSGAGRAARISSSGGGWAPYPAETAPWPGNTESYAPIQGNAFKRIADEPLSTFSIDVDTASYANVRRFLQHGQLPPPDAVRIEEMINYFPYGYAPPKEDAPFAVHVESAACPWNKAHHLVKIGLKGRELDAESRPPCNLVFLIDVSGSMNQPNKLPLVKKSLQLLARQLTENDRVSIVVYASATGLVLPPTPANDLSAIDSALGRLEAGGSTAGGEGIRLAYDEALKNFRPEGNNRVILCTDGDFNVGITDSEELAAFIAERAKKGLFLTVLGFGMGNYKDDRLETLADKGNGNYAYIDSFSEARKILVEQAAGTLFAIAKDVKLQIEFNPAHFDSYRLVGYENRLLAKEDFNDDRKDAGELGAGHVVTAFYELVPTGVESTPGVDPLKYGSQAEKPSVKKEMPANASPEWLTVKLRYKLPKEDQSTKIEIPFTGACAAFENASDDFRFAAGVAAAGFLLRLDPAAGPLTYDEVIAWTSAAVGADPNGYRREFIQLLQNAATLAP
ncbi:MAG: VWA domain-containing protein [Opitutae bacterium]|nr:VWA domain-containing protein [Opitutae bacterium]